MPPFVMIEGRVLVAAVPACDVKGTN